MAVKSRYTLIKGNYWIHYPDRPRQGPQPDGDTIRFQPDNPELVRGLPWFSGIGPDFNARGNIAVRYEGIDALETHFGDAHQELQFANAAREENLRLLGFRNVRYFSELPNVVQSVDANPLPGYVIANGIESNGRLLGLVYAGSTEQPDGSNIFVDAAILDQSVNSKLVSAGLAYVEPYDTMPITLVQHLRQVIGSARQAQSGFFPSEDISLTNAASVPDLATLQDLVMWPKLFRRLIAYFSQGHAGLGQFDHWLRQDPIHRDDTLRLPNGERANMHDAFVINGNSMRLLFNPEELLIAPDPSPMLQAA
jgi:hypothetical protein